MNLRVAVNLAGRGKQKSCAVFLRETQRVMRAVRANLQGLKRQAQIVDRRSGRCEVIDGIDRLFDEVRLGDVAVDECELIDADVLDVLQRAGLKIVNADHAIAAAK